ncbi:MAG: tetratricopeptide repeat protein [Hydrogenophilaceae bacterium]|nr:tetratricopeptide repeat protein [Hydrogenophilaceae bacterium]
MSALENFEKMLAAGKDNALLRYSLGNEYLKAGRHMEACTQFEAALGFDPKYSAAWKLLGRARMELGHLAEAAEAYRQGIAVAEAKGDVQAAKEMTVFLNRALKQLGEG